MTTPAPTSQSLTIDSLTEYTQLAVRTRSDMFEPQRVSLEYVQGTLVAAVKTGNWAKAIKKTMFSGKATDADIDNMTGTSMSGVDVPAHVLHSIFGIINETGEIAELLLGALNNRKMPFNMTAYLEEKGDIGWFLVCDADVTGVPIAKVLGANIQKLRERFPGKFDANMMDDEKRDKKAELAAIASETSKYGDFAERIFGIVANMQRVFPSSEKSDTLEPLYGPQIAAMIQYRDMYNVWVVGPRSEASAKRLCDYGMAHLSRDHLIGLCDYQTGEWREAVRRLHVAWCRMCADEVSQLSSLTV